MRTSRTLRTFLFLTIYLVFNLTFLHCDKNLKLDTKLNQSPDVTRTLEEIIIKKGYPLETHQVVTSDGFILKLFRIPHGKNTSRADKENLNRDQPNKVVLLMHGIVDSANTFLMNLEEKSIAFVFANQGYDVVSIN